MWAFLVLCPGIVKKDLIFLKGAASGERVELSLGVCIERFCDEESAVCFVVLDDSVAS